jgi:Mlc titration factor MtfA (ptsG expression regulator)
VTGGRRERDVSTWLTAVISASLPEWALLSSVERLRLKDVAERLVNHVNWEASRGFALDNNIRGTVAGHAALLALGLPDPVFKNVSAIIVHPATITMRGPRSGLIPGTVDASPLPVLGHTTAHGPVFIAWDVALQQARHPGQGHNVVFHEFAHKLDAEDGTLDGTPRLSDRAERQRWIEVCDTEYRSLRLGNGSALLSEYAGTSPSEFFAVTTEIFFRLGTELAEERPDLYDVFRRFYHQDPAGRR